MVSLRLTISLNEAVNMFSVHRCKRWATIQLFIYYWAVVCEQTTGNGVFFHQPHKL